MFWPSYPLTQAKTTQHKQNKRALRESYDSIISRAKPLCLILPYSTNLILIILLIMYIIVSFITILLLLIMIISPKTLCNILYKIFFDDKRTNRDKHVERGIFNLIYSILVLLVILQITCLILDI